MVFANKVQIQIVKFITQPLMFALHVMYSIILIALAQSVNNKTIKPQIIVMIQKIIPNVNNAQKCIILKTIIPVIK